MDFLIAPGTACACGCNEPASMRIDGTPLNTRCAADWFDAQCKCSVESWAECRRRDRADRTNQSLKGPSKCP